MKFKTWIAQPNVIRKSYIIIFPFLAFDAALYFKIGNNVMGCCYVLISLLYLGMAINAQRKYKQQKQWKEEMKDTIFDESK